VDFDSEGIVGLLDACGGGYLLYCRYYDEVDDVAIDKTVD
jgi:hypothetical protein